MVGLRRKDGRGFRNLDYLLLRMSTMVGLRRKEGRGFRTIDNLLLRMSTMVGLRRKEGRGFRTLNNLLLGNECVTRRQVVGEDVRLFHVQRAHVILAQHVTRRAARLLQTPPVRQRSTTVAVRL